MKKVIGIIVYVMLVIGMISSVLSWDIKSFTLLGVLLLCNLALDIVKAYLNI